MLLKELAASDRAAEYAQTLFGAYRELRADFVHRYLQAMTSDKPVEVRVKAAGHRGERLAAVVGSRAIGDLMLPRDQAVAQHRAYSAAHHRGQ